jgi:hypothetical protein
VSALADILRNSSPRAAFAACFRGGAASRRGDGPRTCAGKSARPLLGVRIAERPLRQRATSPRPAWFLTSKIPCQLPQGTPGPARWYVRLPSVCPARSSQGMTRPGPVCACRCVFAFARKAATCRCLRAAASWAASGYSPGIPFWEGLLPSQSGDLAQNSPGESSQPARAMYWAPPRRLTLWLRGLRGY